MTTILDQHSLTAIIAPVGVYLDAQQASVTLDEGWSPYAQAQLTCKLPDEDAQELLDLRNVPLRVDLRARQDFASAWRASDLTAAGLTSAAAWTAFLAGASIGKVYQTFSTPWNAFGRRPSTSRRFDLMVTERVIDHNAGTLTITAASDEALLQSDALVASAPLNPGTTSVRAIVDMLLERIGAALQPGTEDATVEADATLWKPGDTAWDYVEPLLQSASLKLWCDEQRRWHLTEVRPTVAGAITLNPSTHITELTDTMAVTGEVWYDAVVIRYRWVDTFDLNQTAYDVAGSTTPRNVFVLEYEKPYPGPGAAAGILSRAQGRGRVLDVRAVSDYSAVPGLAATITPPETEAQTGFVSAVTWNFPDAEMDIATRGLVDTPSTSYLFVPKGITYLDVPVGVSYLEYTPELIGA